LRQSVASTAGQTPPPGVLAEFVDAGLKVTEDGHHVVLTVPPENFQPQST
jgi:hypothetical protein